MKSAEPLRALPLWLWRGTLVTVAVALLASVASLLTGGTGGERAPAPFDEFVDSGLPAPSERFPQRWADALDHDLWWEADLAALADPAASDLGAERAAPAADLAAQVVTAHLTGEGRDRFGTLFDDPRPELHPDRDLAGTCRDLQVKAAAADSLPVPSHPGGEAGSEGEGATWAKAIVVWTATCPAAAEVGGEGGAGMSFVYLRADGNSWEPVREGQVPGSASGYLPSPDPTPEPWELVAFSTCGDPDNATYAARAEVVAAFEVLCQKAAADGVPLRVTSALRGPSEQADRFDEAAKRFQDSSDPASWIAYSEDGDCASRHCAGAAIDIADVGGAHQWLGAQAGCFNGADGTFTQGGGPCAEGSVPVTVAQRHGFAQPIRFQPWHLEYAVPGLDGERGASCDPATSASVPQIVAAVWRCRLGAAGLPREQVDAAVARALVVSRCESGWNPEAVAYGGRFIDTPDPRTGRRSDGLGLFQTSAADAARFELTWDDLRDPVVASEVAARLWLTELDAGRPPFLIWPCAAGDLDRPAQLPEHGGPPLPAWAHDY